MVFNVVLGASCRPCLRMAGLHCSCPLGCAGEEGAGGFHCCSWGMHQSCAALGGFVAGASPGPFLFLNLNSNPVRHWGFSIKENKKPPIVFLFSWYFVAFLLYFGYLICAVSSHLQLLIFNLPQCWLQSFTSEAFESTYFSFSQCHWITLPSKSVLNCV